MRRMIAGRELLLNELADAATSPNIATKAEGLSTFEQQGGKLRLLLKIQQRGGAGCRVVTQRLRPLQSSAREPLANRTLGDIKSVRDVLLGPALLVQFPGTKAAAFAPTDWRVVLCYAHELGTEHFPAHDY